MTSVQRAATRLDNASDMLIPPVSPGPIIVEGPFASNPLYLRALATLTGAEVIAAAGSTGTTAGAALLTGITAPPQNGSSISPDGLNLTGYRRHWLEALAAEDMTGSAHSETT